MTATAIKPKPVIDPDRQAILDKLGDLSHVRIAQNEFLMAIYIRSEMTPGGIIVTPTYRKEDEFQGKVGLVVKIGDACNFVRVGPNGRTYGIEVKLYDWVAVRASDSWQLEVNGDVRELNRDNFVKCRLVYDDMVRMVVDKPGVIW